MASSALAIQLSTPPATQRTLSARMRAARVALGVKQATLAARSGVTLASLRRFEQSGEVSLKHLLRISHALGRLDEFDALFRPTAALTMAELETRVAQPARKRGTR